VLLDEFGVNHLDTAADYGDSELRLAPWLANRRGDFFVATKTANRSGDGARVKVSGDDLEYLSPGVGMAEAARELGVAVALVTLGGDGALIVTADGAVQVDAPKVTVVDTIGAGDAFGGGFLTYWSRAGLSRDALADQEAVRAATRFACVVAARTCERAGASPPRLSDLDGDL